MRKVVVIGGGAAGCFAAIRIRRQHPETEVTLLEAGSRLLAKVAVTGGGRCNLTNSFEGVERLERVYPRGAQLMKRALRVFSQEDTMDWFESEGVRLVVQQDHCVFPASQDAMQIVRTLERGLRLAGVRVVTGARVVSIIPVAASGLREEAVETQIATGADAPSTRSLRTAWVSPTSSHPASGAIPSFHGPSVESAGYRILTETTEYAAEAVVVTTGGSPKAAGLGFLEPLGLETVPPVPSLFTLRVDDAGLRALMGTLAEVALSLPGTSFRSEGTLLLTDWGISGPATLRLSSYAARYLAEKEYRGVQLLVDWLPGENPSEAVASLLKENPRKELASVHPEGITARLWAHLLRRAGLRDGIRCSEVGSKGAARLSEVLHADSYPLAGRVHFREEFVTCGGVSLSEISLSTLEAKRYPGLYFAGEVLDVDAVTGGFNLQAAWSMAAVVAQSL